MNADKKQNVADTGEPRAVGTDLICVHLRLKFLACWNLLLLTAFPVGPVSGGPTPSHVILQPISSCVPNTFSISSNFSGSAAFTSK